MQRGNHNEDREMLDIITEGPSSIWVDTEDLIDAATVVFGCTPAYVAKFYETYVNVGVKMGFSEEESRLMLYQTFVGTSKFLENTDGYTIMDQVASKGGATEKGLEMLENTRNLRNPRKS